MSGYQYIYSGMGKELNTAASTTANKPNVGDTTIANNEYSESFAGHDCLEVVLGISFAASASGDVVINRSSDPSFATSELYDTITVAASTWTSWSAGEPLSGFLRVQNTSGQTITVYLNKRIQ